MERSGNTSLKNDSPAFLHFDKVSFSYGNTRALEDISLDIQNGELVTLVGPSGCGKSTLLRILAGLLSPTSGNIWLERREIGKLPPEKRQMGWVPQNYALFEHLNVFNNVAFGLRHQGLSKSEMKQRVNSMLALCQIENLAHRYVSALSGGQKQRVAVARALAIQPKVLLLDEPLAALDPQLRHELRSGLKSLIKESAVTTLFVTHDQTEALSLADRVAVLREGKLEQFAPPETLWSRPKSSFVAQFFGSATVLKSRRLNSQTLELLPGLSFISPGEDTPEIALRRNDLRLDSSGVTVRVLHCEYLGENYTIMATLDSNLVLHFISPVPLSKDERVPINFRSNYTPTLIGDIHE